MVRVWDESSMAEDQWFREICRSSICVVKMMEIFQKEKDPLK